MCTIDDGFDAVGTGHFAYLFYWIDLAGQVYLVRDQDQLGFWGDGPLESRGNVVNILWRYRYLDQIKLQALTHLPLAQRGKHPRIVLGGRKNFVTGLKVHSHEEDLKRL